MTLKLTLFSQEKEDFVREILIGSDAPFSDLHQLILEDCRYDEHEQQCFLVCDEDWRIRRRIHLTDNDAVGLDEDIYLMAKTRVGDLLEEEGQHIAYLFDPDGKRLFLMELTENLFGKTAQRATINRGHGRPPQQFLIDESSVQPETDTEQEEIDEQFYGDEGFENDELDMEGYEIND